MDNTRKSLFQNLCFPGTAVPHIVQIPERCRLSKDLISSNFKQMQVIWGIDHVVWNSHCHLELMTKSALEVTEGILMKAQGWGSQGQVVVSVSSSRRLEMWVFHWGSSGRTRSGVGSPRLGIPTVAFFMLHPFICFDYTPVPCLV